MNTQRKTPVIRWYLGTDRSAPERKWNVRVIREAKTYFNQFASLPFAMAIRHRKARDTGSAKRRILDICREKLARHFRRLLV